jgi:two-component sensor histidine kinase
MKAIIQSALIGMLIATSLLDVHARKFKEEEVHEALRNTRRV